MIVARRRNTGSDTRFNLTGWERTKEKLAEIRIGEIQMNVTF